MIGWMKMIKEIESYLEELYPNPEMELNYNKDYELVIAIMLSAQTTDKRVNTVTPILFEKYDNLEKLSDADMEDVANIIKPIGTHHKKAKFIKMIAKDLLDKCNGVVPNNRELLESMPGIGRKTTNVILSTLFHVPALAVDTHVSRVSKRLGLAEDCDNVTIIEQKLMKKIAKDKWGKRHYQLVLFGRYHCTAIKPNCSPCKLKNICKFYK